MYEEAIALLNLENDLRLAIQARPLPLESATQYLQTHGFKPAG